MDSRRWWLLSGVVPVLFACAIAAGDTALRPLGDVAVAVTGLASAATIWAVGRSTGNRAAWRLMALAPLFPVLGALLATVLQPEQPLELVVLRWVPTVPGYLLAIAAILALVDPARLRAGGHRLALEVTLFSIACVVVVQLLVVGQGGRWAAFGLAEQVILGAAVVVTSATMAAALTLLGVIEASRQRMAVVLLAGAVLLTAGRGLGTSALLAGAGAALDLSRFLVVAGLCLLVAAVLVDPGPSDRPHGAPAWSTDLGQVLPHVAMVIAVTTVAVAGLTGPRPSPMTLVGALSCVALAAVHRWVTAREARLMDMRLRRSEAYFRSLVRSSGDAVVILDDALRISSASPALDRALGPAAAQLIGRPLLEAVHPEDRATLAAALPTVDRLQARAADAVGLLVLRLQDADGVWRYLEAGVSDLRRDADVGAVVLHCRDMTERHAREQALQQIAYTDPMTGLPNRAGLLQVLQEALSAPGPATTLLMIEIDALPAARENAGRGVVSDVVAEIGRRVRATVRGEDVVARMGGGAFAVLAQGEAADADRLAARCLAVVEQPIVTPSATIELTAAVGLATLDEGVDVETLLTRADLAVRAAHTSGLGSAARYRPSLGEAAARDERLRTDLQGAGDRGELFLRFQPIASLEQQRITGLKAVPGWRHPDLGEIAPSEFLPIAERTGLIGAVQRWALDAACAGAMALPEGAGALRVGLSAPTAYIQTGALVGDVEAALTRSGLAPERLVLAISAATVETDDERVGFDISSLRLMGVHVALEDFGAGSSALAHLTRLPIDIVKLDRALISRLDRDPQTRALCESVIGIGRALGMDVVADGVETPAQLAVLSGFGCAFAQGFLLARPTTLDGITELLADGTALALPGLVSRV